MNPGFQKQTVDVQTSDGLDDVLLECIVFVCTDGRIYRAPTGGTTDGLSVPPCLRNILPASGDDSWLAGVIHDSYYRRQIQRWDVGTQSFIANPNPTQLEADNLILEAMTAQGVGTIRRQIIYRALRMFGSAAWNRDAAKQ